MEYTLAEISKYTDVQIETQNDKYHYAQKWAGHAGKRCVN